MEDERSGRRPGLTSVVVIVLVIAGLVAMALDWRRASGLLGRADWRLAPVAFGFGVISYVSLGVGFAMVNRLFGLTMRGSQLFRVGLISTAMNNLLSTGGLAGYTVRFMLMRQHGLALADIVAASMFHSYMDSLAMLAMLPTGLMYLVSRHTMTRAAEFWLAMAAALLVGAFVLATALLAAQRWRGRLISWLSRVGKRALHRDVADSLSRFDATVTRGVGAFRARPRLLVLLAGLIAVDWGSSIVCLGFCFDALDTPLHPGVLLTGFAVGVAAGALSMVPGGLGVQDGSMVSIFALLGVPLEHAVLSAALFRVLYYFIPFLISLPFYHGLLRASGKETPQDALSPTPPPE